MAERSWRPANSSRQTDEALIEPILHFRRQRLTGKHIAMETGVSPAAASRVRRRAKMSPILPALASPARKSKVKNTHQSHRMRTR